ncbi:hypothetical protein GGG16DRAFT_104631 [Schizophyllum commune]
MTSPLPPTADRSLAPPPSRSPPHATASGRELMSVWRVPLQSRAAPTAAPSSSSQVLSSSGEPAEEEVHIPRPSNAFMIFRKWYAKKHAGKPGTRLSRRAGDAWKALSLLDKAVWEDMAETEKQEHARRYPGWRYRPRRRGKASDPPSLDPSQESPSRESAKRALSMPLPPERPQRVARTRRALSDAAAALYAKTFPARSATQHVPKETDDIPEAERSSSSRGPATVPSSVIPPVDAVADSASAESTSRISPLTAVGHSWTHLQHWQPPPETNAQAPGIASADPRFTSVPESAPAPSLPAPVGPAVNQYHVSEAYPPWQPNGAPNAEAYEYRDPATIAQPLPTHMQYAPEFGGTPMFCPGVQQAYPAQQYSTFTNDVQHPDMHDAAYQQQPSEYGDGYAQPYYGQQSGYYDEQAPSLSYDEQVALAEYQQGLQQLVYLTPQEQQDHYYYDNTPYDAAPYTPQFAPHHP